MSRNLADPSYEPTDEELAELMRRANEDATRGRIEAERELHARIASERAEAKARMAPVLERLRRARLGTT
jgi:hypothetical protein